MLLFSIARAGRVFFASAMLGWILVAITGPATAGAATPEDREAKFKAAAIYNLIIFANWADESFSSPTASLVIGILGEGPVAALLPGLIRGEKWRGRPIVLKHYTSPRDVGECQLLFIAKSAQGSWVKIRESLPKKHLLTVSDMEQFAINGGGVQISFRNNRLHLSVNLDVTRQAGVALSSRLLRLADVIGNPRSGSDRGRPFSPELSVAASTSRPRAH